MGAASATKQLSRANNPDPPASRRHGLGRISDSGPVFCTQERVLVCIEPEIPPHPIYLDLATPRAGPLVVVTSWQLHPAPSLK